MAIADVLKAAMASTRSLLPSPMFAIEKHLVRVIANPRKSTSRWWPSSFSDPNFCPREIALRELHKVEVKEDTPSTALQRIFDTGTALHTWYQDQYLGPAGILWGGWRCDRCEYVQQGTMPGGHYCTPGLTPGNFHYVEPVVEIPEIGLRGRVDGVLVDDKGVPRRVLDMKTINERRFKALRGPEVKDRRQVLIYNHLLRRELPTLEDGVLLYISKNNGELREEPVQYDAEEAESILRGPCLVEAFRNNPAKIPPRECCTELSCKRAKECPVSVQCFSR